MSQLFEHALLQVPIGIWILDVRTKETLFFNPRLLEILEMNSGATAKDLSLDQVTTNYTREGILSFSPDLLSAESGLMEVMMARPSGRPFFAQIRKQKIDLDGRSLYVLAIEDISYEKKLQRDITAKQGELENALREITLQNEALKELDRAKDKFFAMMTHELRTPISAVMATADLLVHKLYDTPEELDHFLRSILEQGGHLLELVNDILDYSKIQAGKLEFFIEHLSLETQIRDLLEKYSSMAKEKNVSLIFQNQVEDSSAWFDPVRMRQILSNVISNAIKFNRTDGSVLISIEAGPGTWVVMVRDQGPGIPKESEGAVFNEFETIESLRTHHKGTGLGMPISKRMIEAMGGRIWFESQPNEGTVFFIQIPRAKVLDHNVYRARAA